MNEAVGTVFVGIFIYLIPTMVAQSRHKKNMGMTVIVNIFLGWTLIGWVIALAMAFGEQETPQEKNHEEPKHKKKNSEMKVQKGWQGINITRVILGVLAAIIVISVANSIWVVYRASNEYDTNHIQKVSDNK